MAFLAPLIPMLGAAAGTIGGTAAATGAGGTILGMTPAVAGAVGSGLGMAAGTVAQQAMQGGEPPPLPVMGGGPPRAPGQAQFGGMGDLSQYTIHQPGPQMGNGYRPGGTGNLTPEEIKMLKGMGLL